MRSFLLATCFCLCSTSVWAAEEVDDPAVKADPLSGLVITATMKQVIGRFHVHNIPEVGDTFEIDLRALPQEKLKLTPAKGDNNGRDVHYIFFRAPLKVEHVRRSKSDDKFTGVFLSATDRHSKSLLYIVARGREKGSEVSIQLYEDGGFMGIGSMAEATGTLK